MSSFDVYQEALNNMDDARRVASSSGGDERGIWWPARAFWSDRGDDEGVGKEAAGGRGES